MLTQTCNNAYLKIYHVYLLHLVIHLPTVAITLPLSIDSGESPQKVANTTEHANQSSRIFPSRYSPTSSYSDISDVTSAVILLLVSEYHTTPVYNQKIYYINIPQTEYWIIKLDIPTGVAVVLERMKYWQLLMDSVQNVVVVQF